MTTLETKNAEIAAACRTNDVKRLELFGSRARADFTAGSDFDFLVEFVDPRRAGLFDRFLALRESLERILDCDVDLVEYSSVENSILRERIEQDRKTVYAA
jgi:predicted nucleotidyltransferase